MIRNKAVLMSLASLVALTCVSVAHAQSDLSSSSVTAEEQNAEEMLINPAEMSKQMINRYFTSIKDSGDREESALADFKIIDIDDSDLADIKVTLNLDYIDVPPLPNVVYHIKRNKQYYQVEQQFCSYDLSPNSPHYGEVSCSAGGSSAVRWQ
ncbi:hypothetical protein DFQ01_101542 [Paenibacillus cellulosilyticus]|uniref:Uncharacterized protein n=1 Tax=Paenibacillus cellulosilyticus TaxID=375489 RepID=A0A2V2Z3H5_9BACL|nr:hypothetical protein [Paenibacillus cellulosilyticus]PWW08816.1 hypothetical protein DFQ01_101542 [Paenibacillus cellulosilyticus]QKS48367.1 hypothetical protein HUB94_29345 [Paenibacillus cellulosilyticus]